MADVAATPPGALAPDPTWVKLLIAGVPLWQTLVWAIGIGLLLWYYRTAVKTVVDAIASRIAAGEAFDIAGFLKMSVRPTTLQEERAELKKDMSLVAAAGGRSSFSRGDIAETNESAVAPEVVRLDEILKSESAAASDKERSLVEKDSSLAYHIERAKLFALRWFENINREPIIRNVKVDGIYVDGLVVRQAKPLIIIVKFVYSLKSVKALKVSVTRAQHALLDSTKQQGSMLIILVIDNNLSSDDDKIKSFKSFAADLPMRTNVLSFVYSDLIRENSLLDYAAYTERKHEAKSAPPSTPQS